MKLNFPSSSKCHSYIFYTPKTEDGVHVTQLPFELKVSFIHILHPENSSSLRVQSIIHTCFQWEFLANCRTTWKIYLGTEMNMNTQIRVKF